MNKNKLKDFGWYALLGIAGAANLFFGLVNTSEAFFGIRDEVVKGIDKVHNKMHENDNDKE